MLTYKYKSLENHHSSKGPSKKKKLEVDKNPKNAFSFQKALRTSLQLSKEKSRKKDCCSSISFSDFKIEPK